MLHCSKADFHAADSPESDMDKLSFPSEIDTQKALAFPIGVASPLWFAFTGAAAAGAAFYWMSQWRAATNLEALIIAPAKAADLAEQAAEAEVKEVVEAPVIEPDDLTRLVGIGAKLAATLAERGVTRFEHIAAWTAEDVAETDKALKLLGRIERDAWVAQARRFAAET